MYSLCQTLLLLSACASQFVDARAVGHQAQAQAQARACTASGSFRVNQIPVRRVNGTNALMAYAKVLRKYAHHADSADDILTKAGVLAEASSVVATPFGSDTEYVSPVTIGDQTFQIIIDTGSSDFWVLGDSLPQRGTHAYYSPGPTATLQGGATWNITFGDGSGASGTVYSDTVTLGRTTTAGQIVEYANEVDGFNDPNTPEDGILGLAFDSLNTVQPQPAQTFLTTAVEQGLPVALFTALLKRGEPGAYTFGAIDNSQFTGQVTFTDIDSSNGFWSFTPDGLAIGGQSLSANPSVLTGIADTGTTLLLTQEAVAEAYYARVPSAFFSDDYGAYLFPCSTDLPDFAIIVNGYSATVPGDFINFGALSDSICIGGIQSASGLPFAIYGDVFLKSQFVVFDRSQASPRIGFAPQA